MRTIPVSKKILWLALAAFPAAGFSQVQPPAPQGMSNPFLWFLWAIIILLAFAIVGVAGVIRNLSDSKRSKELPKEDSKNTNGKKIAGLFIFFMLLQQLANAEKISPYDGAKAVNGIPFSDFYFLMFFILLELFCLFTLLQVLKGMLKTSERTRVKKENTVLKKSIIEKLNASVEIEKEKDILLDHDYDGIRELDNDLPPWWKYGFYLTIVVAVIYLFHYHVTKTGDLQVAELNKSTEKANLEIAEFMKASASNVDETTITYLQNAPDLKEGKDIFVASCGTCHGNLGEGKVGPNLTDNYWLHGGSLAEIFKSIKYGWTEKGMKAWKEELSPLQMARVASFIHSIRNTKPVNAKEAQGDFYSDPTAKQDSAGAVNDSLKIISPDSTSVK